MAKAQQQAVIVSTVRQGSGSDYHDDDFTDDTDFPNLAEGADKDAKKASARRKIEIYWEKKRLKEQLDDFDESEFDF